jgi:hypothetical protein
MQYLEQIRKRRAANLADKFKNKSYSETWQGVRLAALLSSFFIQAITAFCALALPAYACKVLFGSWIVGFGVGILLLGAFEVIKRMVINNTTLSFYPKIERNAKNEVVGITHSSAGTKASGAFLVVLFLAASVLSSYFGTPILVKEFAPMPAEVNESALKAHFDTLKSEAVAYWSAVKKEMRDEADSVHIKNKWMGVTTRDARSTQLALERNAAAAQDSLNNSLFQIGESERLTIEGNKAFYQSDLIKAQRERDAVGGWFALVTLVFEGLFILCFIFLNHYDFHEACELGLLEAGATFESTKSSRESTVKPMKADEQKPSQRTANGIGFHNEGGVVNGKILCLKANGELKAYSKSQLSSLAGDAERKGNEDRAKYWIEKRSKLENHINKHA